MNTAASDLARARDLLRRIKTIIGVTRASLPKAADEFYKTLLSLNNFLNSILGPAHRVANSPRLWSDEV